jgi:putative phosphoesterase
MFIGLVSDIHGYLPDNAERALAACDTILCAGDTEDPRILWRLQAIAPTIAVLGNCDGNPELRRELPAIASPRLGGVRFLLVHRSQDAGSLAEDVRVVASGHTHVPCDCMRGNVRYVNPGSASRPRGGSHAGWVLIDAADGAVRSVGFRSWNPPVF